MQDVDLFLSLAGIAGVFVGFGALISIRGGSTSEAYEVTYVGMVVWLGVQVVVASLAPVVISRFDVTGHALWMACSVIVLVLFWLGDEALKRVSTERRAVLAATPWKSRATYELVAVPLWLPANIALVLILLGVLPGRELALYLAAVVLILLMDCLILLFLVNQIGRPATT
jgi:hypothetical protein